MNQPYTKSIEGESIWAQIPLYGTTIINLKPTKQELFNKIHGFDIEDIDRLMEFSRETGRVQFALAESPSNYLRMGFLEPVFKELRPPRLVYIPLDWLASSEEINILYKKYSNLLESMHSLEFIKMYIEEKYPQATTSPEDVKKGITYDLIRLRYVGYKDLVEDFARRLTNIDVTRIILIHETIHDFFLYPLDPLKGIKSFKRRDIHELNEHFPFSKNLHGKFELPCEIGKFLNNKLKLIAAKDSYGAIALSDEYDLYDLRKVAKALNDAIEREDTDSINKNSIAINQIFDNVWRDADKLRKKINDIRYGVSLGFGVIGTAANLPFSGMGGLLAGLGFVVADKFLEKKAYESASEKLSKLGTQSHLALVYDFKKKYKLF